VAERASRGRSNIQWRLREFPQSFQHRPMLAFAVGAGGGPGGLLIGMIAAIETGLLVP